MRLAHLTLASGDLRMVARADADEDGIAEARRLLDVALDRGVAQVPPPHSGYALAVERFGSALLATVLGVAAGGASLERIMVFGVTGRHKQGRSLWEWLCTEAGIPATRVAPPAPWCTVVLLPALERHDEAIDWLAGFEQDVAWAWLERDR